MKPKYLLFTLSFFVLGAANAEFIPKNKLEDYKQAVILASDENMKCPFHFYEWAKSRPELKEIVEKAFEGHIDSNGTQPIITLTGRAGSDLPYDNRIIEYDVRITTDVNFRQVIKVDMIRRDLVSEYANLGTIAKPHIIKSRTWKTTYEGVCE